MDTMPSIDFLAGAQRSMERQSHGYQELPIALRVQLTFATFLPYGEEDKGQVGLYLCNSHLYKQSAYDKCSLANKAYVISNRYLMV